MMQDYKQTKNTSRVTAIGKYGPNDSNLNNFIAERSISGLDLSRDHLSGSPSNPSRLVEMREEDTLEE
tara:strand:+ start:272 stop:475 length:204 start_codon:yes stop_codon:yes gene_type:complete